MNPLFIHLVVAVVSAVGIAYQIALMRVFSIAQWHHFAYMIISIAMLGFGAAGTALSLARRCIRGRELAFLRWAMLLLVFSLTGCYALSQWIPFETMQLIAVPGQLWRLAALYVVLAFPFFLVSASITLAFFVVSRHVGLVYFSSMAGSGLGAAAVVALLYFVHPRFVPWTLCLPVGMLFLAAPAATKTRRFLYAVLAAAGIMAGLFLSVPVRMSQYKGLSYALQLPDAEVLAVEWSPLSVVTAVSSKQIRETPGQISNYPASKLGYLPEQIGLFFDGGAVSPVNRFSGNLQEVAYLDYVTGALAYYLVKEPRTLVVGAGGGTEVLGALLHGAPHVTAVEVDPEVFDMVRRHFGGFSGGLYNRPDVRAVVAEGRGFLESNADKYDVIQIPLIDSFNAASAGVHALNESYLYTVEAVRLYLDRLTDNGVLAITRWLKTPPRDALKVFATVVEACERAGFNEPERHLAFIRAWNCGTVIASRSPLDKRRLDAITGFCEDRWFDVCYYPGIERDEANRYTLLEAPFYYEFAQDILFGDRERVYREALFHVSPATDDCPYFFRFFKWSSLGRLIRGLGTQWALFVEWGYTALVATLVQGALVGAVLILLPLAVLGRTRAVRKGKVWTLVYFGGLGLAYMFMELAFIQKFMLLLAYPIYAVAVILAVFLLFSGLGSLYADRSRAASTVKVGWAVLLVAALAMVYMIALPPVFESLSQASGLVKVLASIGLLAPVAFLMGIPFPTGLQRVSDRFPALVPWAWGINGCSSVVGATLATFLAVHLGFRVLVALAVIAYFMCSSSLWLSLRSEPPERVAGPGA